VLYEHPADLCKTLRVSCSTLYHYVQVKRKPLECILRITTADITHYRQIEHPGTALVLADKVKSLKRL